MNKHSLHNSCEMVMLGEVTEIVKGGTPNRNVSKYFRGDIAWAIPSDITALDSALYINDTATHITEEALGKSAARLLPVGTVLLTSRATIGETAITTVPMATNQGFANFICRENLLNVFLAYYLRHIKEKLNDLASGSTFKEVTKGTLLNIEIPLFPLEEQRAIAEVLSDVDGLIDSLDALIAKKQAIKQATMQQLLTGKTRLPGFSGKWETKQLAEIGDISGAGVDKKINPNEISVRLVNYLDVYNKTFLYAKDLTHEVSARPDQVRRCVVEKGDIFFTPSSEVPDDIGCSAVAMEDISDGVYSYHVVRLRLKADWDLYFRAYIFDTSEFLNQASRQCDGSGTRYVISLPKFRAMTVRFPSDIEEQHAIASVLSDMDAEITALEQRRDKTIAIKQGMMQQLLTGRVRLVK